MDFLYIILGLILGGLLVWLYLRTKSEASKAAANEKIKLLEESLTENKALHETKDKELILLNNSLSSKETELFHLNSKLQDQKKELVELQEKLNLEFKNLANEILEEKSKKFTAQNKDNLGEILKPLQERIKEFEKKVEETYDKEAQQRFSLKEEVKRLSELNQLISKEANSLTKALKGESKTQGNWGEVILENILERTGLRKGQEYFTQESFTAANGKRFQPDVIVHYPGERSIVIDSKVSLTAYERFCEEEESEKKEQQLKAHLLSVKNHINELASKNYQDIEDIKTLDFVVLFMPIEPAYLLAVQNDSQLWTMAYEKRILLVSPTNLVAILKMIDSLWKQEYQSRNVLEIARQGGNLYDSFVMLSERLIKLGKKMDEASGFYKETMKNLSEGKGNLISRVEKLKELGVKTKKQMPDNLRQRALEEENPNN